MNSFISRIQMRNVAASLAALMLAATCLSAVEAAEPRKPEMVAVLFTAEWCQKCEAFEGKLQDLGGRFDGEPIIAVIMDYTDRITRHDSEMLASVVGLADLWNENNDQLGLIYLLDAQTMETLDTLIVDDEFSVLVQKIENALAKARQ